MFADSGHRVRSSIGKVEAFGERKSVAEWARDPRCVVSERTLRARLRRGARGEEAITKAPFAPATVRQAKGELWTAFGRSLTVRQWTEDPRCNMKPRALRARLESGMDPETAITKPPAPHKHEHTAFGVTKSIVEWSRDERCAVPLGTLCQRLERGWSFLRALVESPISPGNPRTARTKQPRKARRVLPDGDTPLEAFGERRTLREWADDPRCQVPYSRLRMRLRDSWSLEDAVEFQPAVGNRNVEAFGESKSLYAWEKDPRCQVTHKTLRYRMARGESLEEALLRPAQHSGPVPRKGTKGRRKRGGRAFVDS